MSKKKYWQSFGELHHPEEFQHYTKKELKEKWKQKKKTAKKKIKQ